MKLSVKFYINELFEEFDSQHCQPISSRDMDPIVQSACRTLWHSGTFVYQWSLVKLCVRVYINELSDQFDNQPLPVGQSERKISIPSSNQHARINGFWWNLVWGFISMSWQTSLITSPAVYQMQSYRPISMQDSGMEMPPFLQLYMVWEWPSYFSCTCGSVHLKHYYDAIYCSLRPFILRMD